MSYSVGPALTYGHKKSADLPYSDTGLRQPITPYEEVCTKCTLQQVLFLPVKTLIRGRSSCQRFEQIKVVSLSKHAAKINKSSDRKII